ncbi:NaeI family type II restriction endonuclease, partial [Streptomyces boncukensis]
AGVGREFGFAPNPSAISDYGADFFLEGVPVDFKFRLGRKPPYLVSYGALVMFVTVSGDNGVWDAGLWTPPHTGARAELKSWRDPEIRWLFRGQPVPDNPLLRMPGDELAVVFGQPTAEQRMTELLRRSTGRVVSAYVLGTVGMIHRVGQPLREAVGSLAEEGIVVLGYPERGMAETLRLPRPRPGEYVSVRLLRVGAGYDDGPVVELAGARWAVAGPDDPVESVHDLLDVLWLSRRGTSGG